MRRIVSEIRKHREAIALISGLLLYCVLASLLGLSCPIKYITGISCPGCGMTRSLSAIVTLDFAKAWYYHPLIFLLIPVIPIVYFLSRRHMFRERKAVIIVVGMIFIAVYLYRFLILRSPVLVFNPENGLVSIIVRKAIAFFR